MGRWFSSAGLLLASFFEKIVELRFLKGRYFVLLGFHRLKVVSVVLIQDLLRVLSAANDWHFDRQSFFCLVKFRTASCLVNFVHQVDIEVIYISVLEHQSILVYVELGLFQTLEELDVNRHSERLGQLVNLFEV